MSLAGPEEYRMDGKTNKFNWALFCYLGAACAGAALAIGHMLERPLNMTAALVGVLFAVTGILMQLTATVSHVRKLKKWKLERRGQL